MLVWEVCRKHTWLAGWLPNAKQGSNSWGIIVRSPSRKAEQRIIHNYAIRGVYIMATFVLYQVQQFSRPLQASGALNGPSVLWHGLCRESWYCSMRLMDRILHDPIYQNLRSYRIIVCLRSCRLLPRKQYGSFLQSAPSRAQWGPHSLQFPCIYIYIVPLK